MIFKLDCAERIKKSLCFCTVKQSKITENASKIQPKHSTNVWKNKAKLLRLENTYLRKRVKEITISRDSWKTKYKTIKDRPEKRILLEKYKELPNFHKVCHKVSNYC